MKATKANTTAEGPTLLLIWEHWLPAPIAHHIVSLIPSSFVMNEACHCHIPVANRASIKHAFAHSICFEP
jgi:hypothetical protein